MMRALHAGVAFLLGAGFARGESDPPHSSFSENLGEQQADVTCVEKHSLGRCEPCFSSVMCAQGWYCCPYMKKCVTRCTRCPYPIADCRPSCFNDDPSMCRCGNPDFKMHVWQKPLCTPPSPDALAMAEAELHGQASLSSSASQTVDAASFCSYPMWNIPGVGTDSHCRQASCPKRTTDCDGLYGKMGGDTCTVRCAGAPRGAPAEIWRCQNQTTEEPWGVWKLEGPGIDCDSEETNSSIAAAKLDGSSPAASLRGSTAESAQAKDSSGVLAELYP
eukprot:TRINITY_DN20429_c1_g1_i1.p1 TRINITY_DN20429_c1_g1~~TRINITY_DN20429_c1_g1_i1.p1  ORF type:complete len:276 (-),score=34.97 TRINITY_DN20429_c1_g1_i1:370-1197(-)